MLKGAHIVNTQFTIFSQTMSPELRSRSRTSSTLPKGPLYSLTPASSPCPTARYSDSADSSRELPICQHFRNHDLVELLQQPCGVDNYPHFTDRETQAQGG